VNAEDHEAGHALAAILAGHRLRYVTVVPSGQDGGHAHVDVPHDWWKTPAWLGYGVVVAAGMIGEYASYARYADAQATYNTDDFCRMLAVDGGGTGSTPVYDTATLRWIARTAWTTAQDNPAVLGPQFNPAWAANPDGVRAIAAHCWANAVHLVAEHAGSLFRIGRALKKHRTLTGKQVHTLITRRPHRRPIDPELLGTDFWLADYSRLVWRPHGMCRTVQADA
jgi:hypothetical protein